MYLELMNKDTSEITLLLLSYHRILNDLADLVVESPFFLLPESSNLFLE